MDMNYYKKMNLTIVASTLVITLITFLLWNFGNWTAGDGYYFVVGFLKPIFWGTLILSGVLLFLLIFRDRVFELWLKYIASWFVPLAVFVVASISVYSSGVLSIGRGEAAFQLSIVLGVITFVFAIGYTIIARLRK